jgi:hypothetical protein
MAWLNPFAVARVAPAQSKVSEGLFPAVGCISFLLALPFSDASSAASAHRGEVRECDLCVGTLCCAFRYLALGTQA